MSLFALGLIALSALMHALWNFFGKKISPSTAFFTVAFLLSPLLLLPLIWRELALLVELPAAFWWLVGASGVCQGWYLSSLAEAYRNGHISIAYPLARASPLIIVALTTTLLGQGGISALGLVGMVLILVGSLLLPMQHFRDLRLSNYRNRSTLFALSAACATAGYSIADDRAVKLVAEQLALLNHAQVAILYIWTQALVSALLMIAVQLSHRPWRQTLTAALCCNLPMATLTGAMITATYLLVLWSMQYVDNVSYVVAFRQLSIPIGVLLGITLLHEPGHRPKLTGVLLISVGLVAVALG